MSMLPPPLFDLAELSGGPVKPARLEGLWFQDPRPRPPAWGSDEWRAWSAAWKPWWPPQCRECGRRNRRGWDNESLRRGDRDGEWWVSTVCPACEAARNAAWHAALPFHECGRHKQDGCGMEHFRECWWSSCPVCRRSEPNGWWVWHAHQPDRDGGWGRDRVDGRPLCQHLISRRRDVAEAFGIRARSWLDVPDRVGADADIHEDEEEAPA